MNETGTPQPGPMGANGTATAQPLEGLASASCSAPTPQPPVDNAHVAPGCQQFTGMKMSYAVEQRLRMVDFLLAQYGHVKRAALMDYFGVGEATVTRDFSAYHDIAPGNMALNPSDKIYYRTNAFARVWL